MKTITESGSAHDIGVDENGVIALSDGKQAYAEIIGCVLRTLLGEIQLDPSVGIDYLGTVFKSVARTGVWKHYATKAIESLPFVDTVVSFDTQWRQSTRTMDFVVVVKTDEGIVEVKS